MGAASRHSEKVVRKWYSALAMRVCIVLCFEHMEGVHRTMVRMMEVVGRLNGGEGEGKDGGGAGWSGGRKRRRV